MEKKIHNHQSEKEYPSNQLKGALERITFFSDGVMAIAVTLLIIEMIIPAVNPEEVVPELLNLLPKFLSHVISFFIIASYWVTHHRIFTYISKYDSKLLWFNLLFLFFVSFLPFPSALLGQYSSIPLVIIIYSINIAFIGFSIVLLWLYASNNLRLIAKDTTPKIIKNLIINNLIGPIGFLVSIPFTFLSVYAVFIIWWLTPVIGVLYRRIAPKLLEKRSIRRIKKE
jgi:uncharacterized membrane protein